MVNFEEPTLIKGAYVVINGVEYPVHIAEYSGGTAVNPENMNKLQRDLQNEINTKYSNLIGTVIFENSSGTTDDTIEFYESINEGELIEINFGRRRANGTIPLKSTGLIPYSLGVLISLDTIYNTVSGIENDAKRVIINNSGLITDDKVNNNIAITKIIKYVHDNS